jgi:hypothetical protein
LDRHEHRPEIHGHHLIEFFDRKLIVGFHVGNACIVHNNIDAAKYVDRFRDGVFYSIDIGAVGTDGQGAAAGFLNFSN